MGAAVWPGGTPSPTLRRRCAAAAALFGRGGFDRVIPSGGVGRHPPSEARVMADLLIGAGVPEHAILPEDQATTTMETARLVARMVDPGTRITIVSDGYHLPRCRLAFRGEGFRAGTVSARSSEPRPRLRVSARAGAREAVGIVVYALRLLWRQVK